MFSIRDLFWTDDHELRYKPYVDQMIKDKQMRFVKRLTYTRNQGLSEEDNLGYFYESTTSVHVYRTL